MQISEPTTMLTDYLLTVECVWLARRLTRDVQAPAVRRLWGAAFGAIAIAALTGGSEHGFRLHLSNEVRGWLFLVTYACIGLANLLMLVGMARATLGPRARRVVNVLLIARLLVYSALLAWQASFVWVILDYAFTLLALLLASSSQHMGKARGVLLAGIATSFVAALVQSSGWALHQHFNHNDLFHVIQGVGLWLYFRAACRMDDWAPGESLSARG